MRENGARFSEQDYTTLLLICQLINAAVRENA